MKHDHLHIKTGPRFIKLIILFALICVNPPGLAQSAKSAVKNVIANLMNNKIEYTLALEQARQIDPQLSGHTFKTIVIENEIAIRKIKTITRSTTYPSFHSLQLARQEFKVAKRLLKTRRRFQRSTLQTAQLRAHYLPSTQRTIAVSNVQANPSITTPQANPPTATSHHPTATITPIDAPTHTVEAIAAPDLDEFVDLQ